MCLFVSESDEVFGTLRMYGAAACCNFRVHGRNVVLWPPLSNKHHVASWDVDATTRMTVEQIRR